MSRDPEEIALLRRVEEMTRGYEPVAGSRLRDVTITGSRPDTVVRIRYETARGSRQRDYAVWQQFGTDDPDEILTLIWADVAEYF